MAAKTLPWGLTTAIRAPATLDLGYPPPFREPLKKFLQKCLVFFIGQAWAGLERYENLMVSEKSFELPDLNLGTATEAELAQWLQRHGSKVVFHQGRYWLVSHAHFYQPVHWLARFKAHELIKPSAWCWGYRATLDEGSKELANAALPIHIFDQLSGFGLSMLPGNKRRNLRVCEKNVEIRTVFDLNTLAEQGYPLYHSFFSRTRYGHLRPRTIFEKQIRKYFDAGFTTVLGGFVKGRLGGYLIGMCVEKTAYINMLIVGTEQLPLQISTGLKYVFLKYLSEHKPHITEVADGLHALENPGLCRYKELLGFRVIPIPCAVWMLPGCKTFIKHRWPHKYYRIMGHY